MLDVAIFVFYLFTMRFSGSLLSPFAALSCCFPYAAFTTTLPYLTPKVRLLAAILKNT
jgi:hypothetical protein